MNAPDNSIVRVFDTRGNVAGVGFLASANLIITCAHVLSKSSGPEGLATTIMVDFPLVESGHKVSSRIIFLDANKDIACLDISGMAPKGANPVKLVIADNLWGHTFRTFGFPQGYSDGVWSSGVLRSTTGAGWLQIEDIKDTGYSIQPGFSGGLVWDDQLKSVVGIITAADMDQSVKAAFCIPTRELVNAYPVLRQNIVLACPYRSLDAFEEYDSQYFFGRDRVIAKLIDSIRREPRFLAVLGPSGSGKSSVVKAGLIPALKIGKVSGSNRWQVLTIRPGLQPFAQLEAVGLDNLQMGLENSVSRWYVNNPGVKRLVIFIDQFEELLVSTPETIKGNFVSELAQLLDSSNPCTIILTLRDDFYSRFQQEAIPLANWLERGLVNIPPILENIELYDMIEKPGRQAGIIFEDGLVESIIGDAIEVDRTQESARSTILPLLEFALTQMWEIRQSNTLTHHSYQSIGGVAGGLSQWADNAYHSLKQEERAKARHIFTELVNLGDDKQGIPHTKRIKKYNEIVYDQITDTVVQKLIQSRLLVAGYDTNLKRDQVEIIHEALIYKWSQLLTWIEEDQEYLSVRHQFAINAVDWNEASRDGGLLYRGGRLAKLLQWLEIRDNEPLSKLEREFLEESGAQERIVEDTLRRANAEMERALRMKDEFLANMSHELRTPLNAVLGMSESLGDDIAGPLNDKQRKYVQVINESGRHLLELINDILDLSKIEAGRITLDFKETDIQSVCQASLRLVSQIAKKKDQNIDLKIEEGVGVVTADERRLKQMLVNLLSNAVKYTPQNGKLGLEVHGNKEEEEITFTIWDEGIGIRQEDIQRLFKPFVQLDSGLEREFGGTGLGLSLVAQMARLHGGSVSVSSEYGKGSKFFIVLPWKPLTPKDNMPQIKETNTPNSTFVRNKKQTILVVEDTVQAVMIITDYLEQAGYKVVIAQDGLEAVSQSKLEKPDLILMDIQMPRMGGFEATQKIREDNNFKDIPIIALTALAMQGDRERCLAAGMNEYLSKPVNLKTLLNVIRTYLPN